VPITRGRRDEHESKKPLWLDGAMFFVSFVPARYTMHVEREATCFSAMTLNAGGHCAVGRVEATARTAERPWPLEMRKRRGAGEKRASEPSSRERAGQAIKNRHRARGLGTSFPFRWRFSSREPAPTLRAPLKRHSS